ncbi:MAG: DUF3368 domain-containing protein [Cyanobacteria bacterium J06638_22]
MRVLHHLYGHVIIPLAVADELGAAQAPLVVRNWILNPPDWLQIQSVENSEIVNPSKLDPGEQEAILLAEQINADLIILDDKATRTIAAQLQLKTIGLLGILKDAANEGLLDLEAAFDQLRDAGFWVSPGLLDRLLQDL